MRVLINALCTAGARTGVGHYAAQLVRGLRERYPGDAVDCFPSAWVRGARAAWARARPWLERASRPGPTAAAGPPAAPGWRRRAFAKLRSAGQALLARHFRAACRGGYDLYHEPNFIPLPCELPTVVTLHDLSVLLHPEWHPADRVAHYERQFLRGVRQCTHFLAVSEFTRREVIQTLGVRPERVSRTYNGIRPNLRPLPEVQVRAALHRLGLPPRYLLAVGTIEPRKNLLTLLRAYCALPGEVREGLPLLLVGGWGWNSADVAAYLESEARHKGVRRLGYFPEADLAALYNGARALAFPSLYEGFGLPPLEMMACGGAVLASTAGAVAETAGGRAHLIDPRDEAGWRDALRRVATDDDWWRSLRQGATEVARPFTWERCADQTRRAYEAVCGPARRQAA
jgi:alpha-1,3-rhamnosyl/mannosyltransferase